MQKKAGHRLGGLSTYLGLWCQKRCRLTTFPVCQVLLYRSYHIFIQRYLHGLRLLTFIAIPHKVSFSSILQKAAFFNLSITECVLEKFWLFSSAINKSVLYRSSLLLFLFPLIGKQEGPKALTYQGFLEKRNYLIRQLTSVCSTHRIPPCVKNADADNHGH